MATQTISDKAKADMVANGAAANRSLIDNLVSRTGKPSNKSIADQAIADLTVTPPTPYDTAVLADAPSGYWKMDETSGTVLRDSSGNNRHGTFVAGYTQDQAPIFPNLGRSCLMTTAGDCQIPDNAAWETHVGASGKMSLEAIIKPNNLGTGRPIVGKVGTQFEFDLSVTTGPGLYAQMYASNGSGMQGVSQPVSGIAINKGYHVVMTYDRAAGNLFVYCNGIEVMRGPAPAGATSDTTELMRIGRGACIPGNMQCIAYYPTVLSPARVLAHFLATGATPTYDTEVLSDGPAGYWKCDDIADNTLLDASGNNRHGTYGANYTQGRAALLPGLHPSVQFTTAAGYCSIPDNAAFSSHAGAAGQMTLEAVVKAANYSVNGLVVGKQQSAYEFMLDIYQLGVRSWIWDTLQGNVMTFNGPLTLVNNTAYHLAFTYDRAAQLLILYVNGAEVGRATVATGVSSDTAAVIRIGQAAGPAVGNSLIGYVSNVAYYPTALSPARILAHYNKAAGVTLLAAEEEQPQPQPALVVSPLNVGQPVSISVADYARQVLNIPANRSMADYGSIAELAHNTKR